MPAIFDPRVQQNAQLSQLPSSGLSQLGGVMQEIAAKKKQDDFAIDVSNFQMKQISEFEAVQNGGEHNTNSKTDSLNGAVLDTPIPDYYMKRFNENARELETKYGDVGKQAVADLRVRNFGQITNLYSNIKSTADINWFQDSIKTTSQAVRNGSMLYDEALGSSMLAANKLTLDPQQRDSAAQLAANEITYADFENDLSNMPMRAIDRIEKGGYNRADFGTIDKINRSIDGYLNTRAMKEISSANQSADMSFRHKPDANINMLLKKRGLHEQLAAVQTSQVLAAERDRVSSGDLKKSSADIESAIKIATIQNNPEAYKHAQYLKDAIDKTKETLAVNPDVLLERESVPFDSVQYDMQNPEEFINSRMDIKAKAQELFNETASFFGAQTGQVVAGVDSLNIGDKPAAVVNLSRNIPENFKGQAVKEIVKVNPNIGVAMSLAPQGANPQVTGNRLSLIKDIMTPADKNYLPKDKDVQTWMLNYFGNVEVGDRSELIPAITKAANSAASARFVRNNIQPDTGSEEYKKVLEEITGKHLSFGAKGAKTLNFQLDDGSFADPEKAIDGFENALDQMGKLPSGISAKEMKKYGKLVPTSDNGKYYMKRDDFIGETYYADDKGMPFIFDLKDSYNVK